MADRSAARELAGLLSGLPLAQPGVKGHQEVPSGGLGKCPLVAIRSAQ
jgi:hypothetical protein